MLFKNAGILKRVKKMERPNILKGKRGLYFDELVRTWFI